MSEQMPSYSPPVRPPDPLSPESERIWAALAHLSAVLSLFSGGIFGSLISIIIWGVFKRRSKYVAFQALQAFIFQLATFGFGVCFLLSPFLFLDKDGLFIITSLSFVCTIIWSFALCAYALIATVQCYNGADFRYFIIGNLIPK